MDNASESSLSIFPSPFNCPSIVKFEQVRSRIRPSQFSSDRFTATRHRLSTEDSSLFPHSSRWCHRNLSGCVRLVQRHPIDLRTDANSHFFLLGPLVPYLPSSGAIRRSHSHLSFTITAQQQSRAILSSVPLQEGLLISDSRDEEFCRSFGFKLDGSVSQSERTGDRPIILEVQERGETIALNWRSTDHPGG